MQISYEEWFGEPSWLRVIIERPETGEVLSAFTEPAPEYRARRLREDLEAAREARTPIQFINYYRPARDNEEEINDDLNLIRLRGELRQVQNEGACGPVIRLEPDALPRLMRLILTDHCIIDVRLLEMLMLLTPGSFEESAPYLAVFEPGDAVRVSGRESLVLSEDTREAWWHGQRLTINAATDFLLLKALHQADGAVVSHQDLLRAIRPDQVRYTVNSNGGLGITAPEVKDAVAHIRDALRACRCPLWIQSIKRVGYQLAAPE